MKYLYILILIFPTLIFSQEKLKYNTNGQSIEFEISKNQYYIKFKPCITSFYSIRSLSREYGELFKRIVHALELRLVGDNVEVGVYN